MSPSRRSFLTSAAASVAAGSLSGVAGAWSSMAPDDRASESPAASVREADGYDPWIEVNPEALRANARSIAEVADGRPVLATIKNNGYGLGLEEAGEALAEAQEVRGLAVVKVEEAHRLRDAGVEKPILLMTHATDDEVRDLVRRDVELAPFSDGDGQRLEALAADLGRSIPVHASLDTGLGRLGMPYHRALPWLEDLAERDGLEIQGAFMSFTEAPDFDRVQLERFTQLAAEARDRGLSLGRLHAASSNHLTFLPDSFLDMVRPGLNLFGAHVAGGRDAAALELTPAIRLRARVLRVERLRVGDSAGYGRDYVADDEVWVATVPMGHADGYPREAVEGARVLIGNDTYPVIGAVSASHCLVEVGPEERVRAGDVATLMGPDHDDVHPNTLSEVTGRSIYDILMHLGAGLPKRPHAP